MSFSTKKIEGGHRSSNWIGSYNIKLSKIRIEIELLDLVF